VRRIAHFELYAELLEVRIDPVALMEERRLALRKRGYLVVVAAI